MGLEALIGVLGTSILIVIEVLKKIPFLKLEGAKTIIASCIVGIILALMKIPSVIPNWYSAIPIGILAGLSASGVYSLGANVIKHAKVG